MFKIVSNMDFFVLLPIQVLIGKLASIIDIGGTYKSFPKLSGSIVIHFSFEGGLADYIWIRDVLYGSTAISTNLAQGHHTLPKGPGCDCMP